MLEGKKELKDSGKEKYKHKYINFLNNRNDPKCWDDCLLSLHIFKRECRRSIKNKERNFTGTSMLQ